jgi:hypothetical protein
MLDGQARSDLLPFAKDVDADLIVMGNSVHKTLIKQLLGDTVLETIKSADRPLFSPNSMAMQQPIIQPMLPVIVASVSCPQPFRCSCLRACAPCGPRWCGAGSFSVEWPWMPSLDIALHFRLDGLSLLFGLIVTGTGFLVTLFAASYMAGHPHTGRFFVYLHTFMLAMLGIVMADNLLLSVRLLGDDHHLLLSADRFRPRIRYDPRQRQTGPFGYGRRRPVLAGRHFTDKNGRRIAYPQPVDGV